MNNLPTIAEDRWRLPNHAHIVVYDAEADDDLLTVYDCGVAQAPPTAQFRGHLVRVRAANELRQSPTGYRVRIDEPAILVHQGKDHYVIESPTPNDADPVIGSESSEH